MEDRPAKKSSLQFLLSPSNPPSLQPYSSPTSSTTTTTTTTTSTTITTSTAAASMTGPSTLLERRHGEDPSSAFADPRMHLEYLLNSRALEDYAPHHLHTHNHHNINNNASPLLPVPPLPISVFQDPYNRPHPLLLSDSTPQPVMSPRRPPLFSSIESPRAIWQEPMVISSPTLPLYNTHAHKRRGREKKEKHQERERNEDAEDEGEEGETEEEEEGAGKKHSRTQRRRNHVEGEGSEEGESPKISVFLPPRKRRKRLSASQRTALEAAYAVQRHPSRQEKERMAQELGLSVAQVQAWFHNQRSRQRRQERQGNA